MIGASFDSTETPLQDLLARSDNGELQLPDFQRGWVWNDDRIKDQQILFKARDLPYRTQLVPLASIFVDLGKEGETKGARREPQLFRTGVVTEVYDVEPTNWDINESLEEAAS